jgi:hypothetical protein
MDGSEGFGKSKGQSFELRPLETPVAGDESIESWTIYEFGCDVRGTTAHVHINDARCAPSRDQRSRFCLPSEPSPELTVAGQVWANDLQSHKPVSSVLSKIDDAHPAGTKLRDDLVTA